MNAIPLSAPDSLALPPLVQAYGRRALAPGSAAALTVRVTQVGEMTMRPGGRRMAFTASEDLAVERVAFTWRARFPLRGPLALAVSDSYDGACGRLAVRLGPIPLQRRRGPDLDRGEAYRYLAEIPWAPQALSANRDLRWRQVAERVVEVSTTVAGERIAVGLTFDAAGDIVRAAAQRPRLDAGGQLTTWVGEFSDHRTFDGIRVPARGEVRWELPEGSFTYWRAEITSVQGLPGPPPSGRVPTGSARGPQARA